MSKKERGKNRGKKKNKLVYTAKVLASFQKIWPVLTGFSEFEQPVLASFSKQERRIFLLKLAKTVLPYLPLSIVNTISGTVRKALFL